MRAQVIPRQLSHRRRVRALAATVAVLIASGLALAACTSSGASAQSAVSTSNSLAQTEWTEFNAAVPYPYAQCSGTRCASTPPSNPLERENLRARLKEYNSAGDTNYVYIFAWGSPSPIGYYVIKGKVSSTSSQMTSPEQVTNCGDMNNGDGGACAVTQAIGDDGSYGPEEGGENGVFFYTSTGTLVETDQPFVVSSQPIKLYVNVPQLDAAASK